MSSQTGYNIGNENPLYLSWRKLHLSRAKLKAAGNTSALLAGFAMIGLVEVNLEGVIPDAILIPFAICTVVLVSVHMLALMISTCILPNIDAIAAIASPDSLQLVKESPHEKMHWYIELAWAFSTVFGIILFMVEIVLLCWVQFYNKSRNAAIVATAILIPVILIFIVFAFNFYRKLVSHTYQVRQSGIQDLELMKTRLENGTLESYANQDI